MTTNQDNFEKYAFSTIRHVGGTDPVTMEDGTVLDPLYIYQGADEPANRAYLEFSGEFYYEIATQGIYDEKVNMYESGTHWAELVVVRFSMETTHPVLGDMSIQLDESRSGSRASIRSVHAGKKYPIWNRARMFVTATASAMPGVILQSRGAPLFLHSDEINSWPVRDALYRFDVRIALERRDRPGDIVATLNPGAMRVTSPGIA